MIKEKEHPKNWVNGDVFSLKIISDKEPLFNGRHLIFIKVDERSWRKRHIPIFRVKITSNTNLPNTKEEIENLEYAQVGMTLWEDRFRPLSGYNTEKELIEERSKVTFYPDEFGYLSEYRIPVITIYKKQVPKELNYIGNFDLSKPVNEYVPFSVYSMGVKYWEEIQDHIISKYQWYNQKQSKIYNFEYANEQRKQAEKINRISSNLLKKISEEEEKGKISEKRITELVMETLEED